MQSFFGCLFPGLSTDEEAYESKTVDRILRNLIMIQNDIDIMSKVISKRPKEATEEELKKVAERLESLRVTEKRALDCLNDLGIDSSKAISDFKLMRKD